MTKVNNDYIFYLEPYTFLFKGDRGIIIYNTLNSEYIDFTFAPIVQEVLNELYNSNESYCVDLSKTKFSNKTFSLFIRAVRNSYSGDIIKKGKGLNIPFIFKPLLRLHSNPNDLKIKEEHLLGLNILLYLNEISFYWGETCSYTCDNCSRYYKQFLHCTKTGPQILDTDDYIKILDQLNFCNVSKINLIVGDLSNNSCLDVLREMNKFNFKRELIMTFNSLNSEIKKLFMDDKFSLKVMIHSPFDIDIIRYQIQSYKGYNITWTFIISEEKESLDIENLMNEGNSMIEILPYYNGTNIDFFEKYVYNTLYDILKNPVDKQSIYRREVLNENFFGKLMIFPSGEVYSNINYPSIGNVKNNKLSEIIYNELSCSKAWLKTRNDMECKDCVNRYLCPSISNYEIVIGKLNLCHIKQ